MSDSDDDDEEDDDDDDDEDSSSESEREVVVVRKRKVAMPRFDISSRLHRMGCSVSDFDLVSLKIISLPHFPNLWDVVYYIMAILTNGK